MRITSSVTISLTATLVIAGCTTQAAGQVLTPFRYEAQAQRHCPHDIVVWVDLPRGVYYLRRQKRYARGSTGSFVCRDEARSSGYRRSLFGLR